MMRITLRGLRQADFGFALLIISYLLLIFGSPMPIKVGAIEIVMGIGFILGTLLLGAAILARDDEKFKLLVLCVLYTLLTPLIVGVARGNNYSDIARDVAPLMFMVVLPLIIKFLPHDRNESVRLRILLFAIFSVGLVSALQFHSGILKLFGSLDIYISRYEQVPVVTVINSNSFPDGILRVFGLEGADYQTIMLKCQDPALLFSAIYLLCLGISFVLVKPRSVILGLCALAGGVFCVYEFAALGMRAFSGLTMLAIAIYVIRQVLLKSMSVWTLITAGVLSIFLVYTQLVNFVAQMWAKHQANGLSGRPEELYAALNTISGDFITLLFGVGWGGVLANPIYDAASTRFTHSLISFWLLKTGVIGFAVFVVFVILLFSRVNIKNVWTSNHRVAVFLAASAVIIIGLFLEPTYKMLSFGLVVGLFLAEFAKPPAPAK